ncbi:acyl-CoA dehydrogenase family protein [Amycolatopsis thermophila]|uniref:Alkylation response protein AidB-like acyl-CoA dehydrogenase n=1 Tax=Amycolatopsis thermophila TaxID=206084 RepID=A0ABU0F4H4_9PSEU|nr:acyl-CoA dehydrogenase family protein [Amycolatopsis thermophila]MDQ0382490.1 alkylation response protein AidB-like acyl-CoA dehydrogenase [Amycolatopsis thermophila]
MNSLENLKEAGAHMAAAVKIDYDELREATREFADREVVPIAAQLDLEDARIPVDLYEKMGKIGYFGIMAPEEYGGLGLDARALGVVTEELCRASLSVGSLIQRNVVTGSIIAHHGTEDQKSRYAPGLASGELQSASAGTEPNAGSDAANIQTTARRDGDHYVVKGTKQWCTNADVADVLFLYVRTSDTSKHSGLSLLLVDKPRDGFLPPKLDGTHLATAGYRGMKSFQLYFDDLDVPADNLVGGEEGHAFAQLMAGYEIARTGFAFRCVGLAQAAYEAAVRHAEERVQFDKPLKEFQAVRFRLADMRTQIEAARALATQAAEKLDSGARADLEAGMAKLFAADMAHKVCWDALYIHGGNGYAIDTPVNRYWRDSGLLPIGEGTSDIQREIIARSIVGRSTR